MKCCLCKRTIRNRDRRFYVYITASTGRQIKKTYCLACRDTEALERLLVRLDHPELDPWRSIKNEETQTSRTQTNLANNGR